MCIECPTIQETQSDFADRLMSILNGGATALMLSIGHRSGLLDVMAALEPETSSGIAAVAGLKERYVREWLGAMTTARIVTYDKATQRYSLPKEHSEYLTRAAGANNIGTLSQYIPLLGSVEDGILECFRKGGGLPYSAYGRFHEVMAEDSGQSVLPALESAILPLIPGGKERLTTGAHVLDVGCGRGRAMTYLAERFPKSRFVGYDLSPDAVAWATDNARSKGLSNIIFVLKDAATMDDREEFDFIFTFDAIHDQAEPQKVLDNIYKALRPDGIYLMQDIDAHTDVGDNLEHPIGTLLYTISCMHCMSVSLAGGGAGLGAAWGVELASEMVRKAGFREPRVERLPHDIQNCYYILQK